MALTRDDYLKYIDALEEMLAKGYKRYKVDSEVTFEFFTFDEIYARITYYKDKIDEIDGVTGRGCGFTKKKGYDA